MPISVDRANALKYTYIYFRWEGMAPSTRARPICTPGHPPPRGRFLDNNEERGQKEYGEGISGMRTVSAAGHPTAGTQAGSQLHVWVPRILQLAFLRPPIGRAHHHEGKSRPGFDQGAGCTRTQPRSHIRRHRLHHGTIFLKLKQNYLLNLIFSG